MPAIKRFAGMARSYNLFTPNSIARVSNDAVRQLTTSYSQ